MKDLVSVQTDRYYDDADKAEAMADGIKRGWQDISTSEFIEKVYSDFKDEYRPLVAIENFLIDAEKMTEKDFDENDHALTQDWFFGLDQKQFCSLCQLMAEIELDDKGIWGA